jgi:hypothetical protein
VPAGAKLRLSGDATGEWLWQSLEEQSRSTADSLRNERDAVRGERDALRAERDGLAQRIAELERGRATRDEK